MSNHANCFYAAVSVLAANQTTRIRTGRATHSNGCRGRRNIALSAILTSAKKNDRMRCHVRDDLDRTNAWVLPNQPCSAPNGFNSQRLTAQSTQIKSYKQPGLNDAYQLRSGHSTDVKNDIVISGSGPKVVSAAIIGWHAADIQQRPRFRLRMSVSGQDTLRKSANILDRENQCQSSLSIRPMILSVRLLVC